MNKINISAKSVLKITALSIIIYLLYMIIFNTLYFIYQIYIGESRDSAYEHVGTLIESFYSIQLQTILFIFVTYLLIKGEIYKVGSSISALFDKRYDHRKIPLIISVGFLVNIITIFLYIVFAYHGNGENLHSDITQKWITPNPESVFKGAILILVDCILTPFIEEIYFRGLIFSLIRKNMPLNFSLVLSSVFFVIPHLYSILRLGGIEKTISIFCVFFVGMYTASCYEKYKSLWPGFIFHVVYNFSLYILSWFIEFMGYSISFI